MSNFIEVQDIILGKFINGDNMIGNIFIKTCSRSMYWYF